MRYNSAIYARVIKKECGVIKLFNKHTDMLNSNDQWQRFVGWFVFLTVLLVSLGIKIYWGNKTAVC